MTGGGGTAALLGDNDDVDVNLDDNQNQKDTFNLTDLPPEIIEKVCSFLPSILLHKIRPLSKTLNLVAIREINIRHEALNKVLITAAPKQIPSVFSWFCPGLVLLHIPDFTKYSHLHSTTHTVTIRLIKPFLAYYNIKDDPLRMTPGLVIREEFRPAPNHQALCAPHAFSAPHGHFRCFHLMTLPLCDPKTSAVMYFIKSGPESLYTVRNMDTWNICLPGPDGRITSLLPKSGYSRISLPSDNQEAFRTLARDVLDREQTFDEMRTALIENPHQQPWVVDDTTLVMVMTDSNTDMKIHLAINSFFARFFRPIKICWVKMMAMER